MDCTTVINVVLSILSFVLAAISVITVVITLRQNKKMLLNNEKQLEEMRKERQLSSQPLIELNNERFIIDRPRFFYTPPKDEYSFLSRYHFSVTLQNLTQFAAICVDVAAELVVPKDGKEYYLSSNVRRKNAVVATSKEEELSISFAGDSQGWLFELLREDSSDDLPKIIVRTTYKNTCGGFFVCERTFILAPEDKDFNTIRNWHTCILSAPIEAKEILAVMKTSRQDEKWYKAFDQVQEAFSNELGTPEMKEISIKCIEVQSEYDFETLTKEEYDEITYDYSFGHYIHKAAICKD